ncbi:DUF2125 domain-containing protein [Roseovarius aestuariivivens]|uniref:DUF2125 domain-containing protein n=1 Tax=Roseovarius aestuariivivens TaxID=1888910 RepID=UPI0014368BF6|nr:DUF2125 domain-containing protein [Roseovarius aestuariivivens]
MTAFKSAATPLCTSAVALGLCMTGSAAFADVTASQIWEDWQAYFETSGYTVTGEETLSGGTLAVSDITMTMAIPESDGSVVLSMGEITFEENGDGTVSISLPERLPMTVDVGGSDIEEVMITLEYVSSGLDMTASGDPADIVYDYTADNVALVLGEVTVEDETIDPGTVEFSIANITGTSRMQTGDLRLSDQSFEGGPMAYTVDVTDPEGGEGRMVINGEVAALAFKATAAMPPEMDAADMAAAIADGFEAEGVLSYENGTTEFSFEEDASSASGESSSEGGELVVSLGSDGLVYGLGATGAKTVIKSGDLPFPVEYAMREVAFSLGLPVMASDDPQGFALTMRLADFTMSEMLWSIFDPQGQLPRDPATFDIDMSGVAKLAIDLLDPEDMEAVERGAEMPGELNALDLNTLVLRAAGAELTGYGSFTFDNSDLETFDGLPAPDGSVDLRLQGANGLLDTLIAMGYLPEDQAMGVRMMMGMFAVPGEGEDVLTSTIAVKPDGQVLANGQRLR